MSRRIVTAEEQDAYTAWRKLLCYTQRAGVVKGIKTRTHRRERREAHSEILQQRDGGWPAEDPYARDER